MPVTLELIENNRVMRYVISEPWTMQEFNATFEPSQAYLDAASDQLHSIVVVQGVTKDPKGVLSTRKHPAFSHPRGGYVVFCGANWAVQRIVEITLRLIRFNRVKFFATEAQALEFLKSEIGQVQPKP